MAQNTKITVVFGSIVAQPDCDAIVNAANKNLRVGSGVCRVLHDAAVKELEPYASRFAPLKVGEALATPAFNLPSRFIIHTVGPKYWEDPTPEQSLRRAIRSTLQLADQNEIKKIAIPAISTGVYGYPPEDAVPVMVSEAFEQSVALKCIEKICFVVRDEHIYRLFLGEFKRERVS